MPIKVTCSCGKSFAAPDHLAGRTVQCPNCKSPLAIPQSAPAAPAAPAAPRPAAPTPASAFPSGDLFEQAGMKAAPAGTRPCPGCGAALAPTAVLCITCGYNLKLGRRMETVNLAKPSGGHGGHGEAAASVLERAAAALDEEQEEQKKKTGEGLPWWSYLIGLLFLVGFVVMMSVMEQQVAMLVALGLIIAANSIINFYCNIRILMIAFNDNVTQGLLCVFVPCYGLYYIVNHWDECGGYFLVGLGTGMVNVVVQLVMRFLMSAAPDATADMQRPTPLPPIAVAVALERPENSLPPLVRSRERAPASAEWIRPLTASLSC